MEPTNRFSITRDLLPMVWSDPLLITVFEAVRSTPGHRLFYRFYGSVSPGQGIYANVPFCLGANPATQLKVIDMPLATREELIKTLPIIDYVGLLCQQHAPGASLEVDPKHMAIQFW